MLITRHRHTVAPIVSLSRSDWGDYLSGYTWSHAVDLTSGRETTERALARRFVAKFVRDLARRCQQRVPYFYVIEQKVDGFPHVHALISGTAALCVRDIQLGWEGGFSRVRRYEPERGAAYYITKTLLEGSNTWNLSGHMPTKR